MDDSSLNHKLNVALSSSDNDILERMYINCKCSIERTKTALDMYFSLKTKLPEVMSARDPLGSDIQKVMDIV